MYAQDHDGWLPAEPYAGNSHPNLMAVNQPYVKDIELFYCPSAPAAGLTQWSDGDGDRIIDIVYHPSNVAQGSVTFSFYNLPSTAPISDRKKWIDWGFLIGFWSNRNRVMTLLWEPGYWLVSGWYRKPHGDEGGKVPRESAFMLANILSLEGHVHRTS